MMRPRRYSSVYAYLSASGVESVTPRALPRGTMVILRTGSAPGWSMPRRAWPLSW